MPDPRNTVSQLGVHRRTAVFDADGVTITYDDTAAHGHAAADPRDGLAVTLSGNNEIALADDADAIIGKLILVEDGGQCTVQVGGMIEFPGGLSATLTLGTPIVGDQGAASALGYVRSAASAQAAELLVAKGSIVDASTTTRTVVWFG